MQQEVIDHMARLDFKIKPQGGTLISFQYEYVDYLDEINCIDPKTAKTNVYKAKKITDKKLEASTMPEALAGVECDIEEMDEGNDELGRFRYENVIKSMVARLELYNSLAPI